MTRSPSIRPSQPRRSRAVGVNMQSLIDSRLGVDDYVRDLRPLTPDALLDLARSRVRRRERRSRLESERQVRDEAFLRVQESELARGSTGRVARDPRYRLEVALDVLARGTAPRRRLAQRLEVRLDGTDLGHGVDDRMFDGAGDFVSVLEREVP